MTRKRVFALGLDGFELSVAEALIAEGRMPHLADLRARGSSYLLDHGSARETGLAWEHFATGKDPDTFGRWSAVNFDPATYRAHQSPTRAESFLDKVDHPVVTFDIPYFDLRGAPAIRGMANWGAHDPGVEAHSNPPELVNEIAEKFGPYPGSKYIYGFVWPSVDATEDMADRMIAAMQVRSEVTSWLFKTRLPDWQLAITVVAELHSVSEALWHGVDPDHPLHAHPSAAAARRGIEGVYIETDKMIGRLAEEHPDADLVVFSMHGMGPNIGDLASMALLPEMLYRRQFGRPFLHPAPEWDIHCPILGPGENWSRAVNSRLRESLQDASPGEKVRNVFGKVMRKVAPGRQGEAGQGFLPWMPSTHYARHWPEMDAFALPAFYDGQVRINLEGREARGRVPLSAYSAILDEIETMVKSARDPATGESVVAECERPLADDPFADTETRCDLKIQWKRNFYAADIPGMGRVGPIPQRRTGGHTGAHGFAVILGQNTPLASDPTVSSFDMVPTILDLAGIARPAGIVGTSLVGASQLEVTAS